MFYHALTGNGGTPIEDLGPVLLWTNSNPTAEFAPQTVSLDLSNYIGVIIECLSKTNEQNLTSRVYIKKGETLIGGCNTDTYPNVRLITAINDEGVSFGIARDTNTHNNYTIPYKIYGVREYVVEPVSGVTAEQKFFKANKNQTIYTLEKDYDLLMIDGNDTNSFIGYLDEGNFDEILSGEIYHFAPTTKRLWVKGAKAGFKYEVAYADMNFNFTGLIYNK